MKIVKVQDKKGEIFEVNTLNANDLVSHLGWSYYAEPTPKENAEVDEDAAVAAQKAKEAEEKVKAEQEKVEATKAATKAAKTKQAKSMRDKALAQAKEV
ncbi:MAG: hypothetical protein DSY80_04170 [Desulfocapsa sp.]|nr:MAG: hypothetical protein DSY80_04170 [Desulfocapsa sp.]